MKLSDVSVKLSRNGWHRKLQVFTFGHDVPLFPNLCPYFWLTIAGMFLGPMKFMGMGIGHSALWVLNYLLLAPMVIVGTAAGKVLDRLLDIVLYQGKRSYTSFGQKAWSPQGVVRKRKRSKFADLVVNAPDQIMMRMFDTLGKGLDKVSIYFEEGDPRYEGRLRGSDIYEFTPTQWEVLEDSLFERLNSWYDSDDREKKEYKDIVRSWEVISAWRTVHPDWEERQTHLVDFKDRWLKAEKDKERAYRKAQKERERLAQLRREKFIKVGDFTKVAATLGTVLILASGCLALLVKFGLWLWNGGTQILLDAAGVFASWLLDPGLMYLCFTVASLGGVALVVGALVTLFKALKFSSGPLANLGRSLVAPFVWSAGKIAAPLGIFFVYAMAVKQNQCPGIDWEE